MRSNLTRPLPTRRTFLRGSILAANGLYFGSAWAVPSSEQGGLELEVSDTTTGHLLPCSVAVTTSQGKLLTAHKGYGGGIRCPGELRTTLPPGRTTLLITRGFDYVGQERVVEVHAGEVTKCSVSLARVSTLRKDGWVCGDNHVHMKHGESVIEADFAFVGLSARAEALDYMSVAQQWNVASVTPAGLSQALSAVATPDCTLAWNMEAPKNYWMGDVSHCMGHGWTLGVRDVGPEGTDPIQELFAMSAGDYQKEKVPTPNFDSHAYVHAAGGIVSYTHPCRIWRGEWGGKNGFPVQKEKFVSNMAQELPFDTVAGPTYDSIDILMQTGEHVVNELGQRLWFMLLNRGYRIAGTASTDATFDNPGRAVPGVVRVYTRIDGAVETRKVSSAMKAGRNFVTSGPLLQFTIGSHNVGDVLHASSSDTHRASIKSWASGRPSEFLRRIEVIRNGEIYNSYTLAGRPREHQVAFDIRESENAWYIVRCFGSSSDQVAITNPIYFETPAYRAPESALATVNLRSTASGSGEALNGTYDVLEMIGRKPRVISIGEVKGGMATISAPATARIRLSAPGHAPQVKSIFMDTPDLMKLTTEMQLADLVEWTTYERVRDILSGINLHYDMQPSA